MVLQEMMSTNAVEKVIKRAKTAAYPPNVPLPQLVINGPWMLTLDDNPQRFLLHDNMDDSRRVIIFSSPQCLEAVANARDWFMDGNFSIAPPQFSQLYIIRIPVGESAVTAAFAILQRKCQSTYRMLLESLVNECIASGYGFPQVTKIHCDFEKATHQAIRQVLPQAAVTGCFYHLSQVGYNSFNCKV